MAHVVLFHSILGLRPGVTALARRLGAQGHPTTAPDLYDGRSTADVDEGFAIHRAVGRDVLMDRARAAVAALPPATVLMGISAGAGIAGDLWVERPEAAGVVFLSGPGPIPEARPSDAPVQMHMARPDPFDDEDFVTEWSGAPNAQPLTIFRYDGVGHNFLDEGGPDWDEAATRTCEARLLAFLSSL
jgi:dienelactone hydrolase